jgi:hypothetical protein
VADHVPLETGEIGQEGLFRPGFLNPILTDKPQPGRVSRPNKLARLRLRHGDDSDGIRFPLRPGGRSRDASPNLLEIGLNLAFKR